MIGILTYVIDAEEGLDTPCAIFNLHEGYLAHFAHEANTASDGKGAFGSLPFIKVL